MHTNKQDTKDQTASPDIVTIYTDGACSGNPGPGGWGVVIQWPDAEQQETLCGGQANTTNNRMELLAAIHALTRLPCASAIRLYTDSKYVCDGITSWIKGWKAKNLVNSAGKPVKNADLWKQLDEATHRHRIEWLWVKGHAGNEGNEQADTLARQGMAPYQT